MASRNLIRFEALREREYRTTGTDVIEQGDHVVIVSGKARPASTQTDATGANAAARLVVAQDKVADIYGGIALQAKESTKTPNIRVGVDVVAEYELNTALTADKDVGEKVEIHGTDDGTTTTPKNQVISLGTVNPIGLLAKPATNGDTTVTVHFVGVAVRAIPVAD